MAQDYRQLPEWQALNRIWKAVPAAAREQVKEDFRIVSQAVKAQAEAAPAAPEKPVQAEAPAQNAADENFMVGMSKEARAFYLGVLTREGFDIYAYVMKLIPSSQAQNLEELWDAYVSQRDVEEEDEAALTEIMTACLKRAGLINEK